ncbi:MAG: hypothetical protein QOI01_5914 [Mycobacterium sp.]|nr:hypothetical protein [Mycobacterium sp.]
MRATSRPLGTKEATAVGECHLRIGDVVIGSGARRIASSGLEVVAAAAVNHGRVDDPLSTASLRVNFLRQFFAGDESRYVGTALRVGRRSGVAEAQAIGSDGKPAIIARLTAYR